MKKPRKEIKAEINKNLGDNPDRIAKNIKVDPRPIRGPEQKKPNNRYSRILEARKQEKRLRNENKMKIPHIKNKKNLVKRWKVEAQETNLIIEEYEEEIEGTDVSTEEKAIISKDLKIDNKLELNPKIV